MLKGKTVILGVTGSIAAYKAANLASLLKKQHADVHVIMTRNGTQFINPITFESLTGNKCLVDTFDRNFQFQVEHVELAKRADLAIVGPATANVMAKLAHGLADDMLTTTLLACQCPKLIAPAMNTRMYENPVTRARMAMLRGADVTLVTGKVALEPPHFVEVVPITTARELFEAVTLRSGIQDMIIKAAAVADYRPAVWADEKLKKSDAELSIALERTEDTLQYLGEHKKKGQLLCGFAMETSRLEERAREKLERKNLDLIAANNVKVAGAGFGTDTNVVTLITRQETRQLELMSKEAVATEILDTLAGMGK